MEQKANKKILLFNARRSLIAVFRSACTCAYALKINPSAVYQACDGRSASVNSYYTRYLDPNIEISVEEDIGTLSIEEYDRMCGNDRPIYIDSTMKRDRLSSRRKKASSEPKKRGRPRKNPPKPNRQ